MKRVCFRIFVLCCIALVLLSQFSPPADASSYCPGCKAAVIGAAVGIGVGVSLGIYLIHRSHTSLTGCVQQTGNGFILTAKDGHEYELVNPPSEVKAHERLSLRGHKTNSSSRRSFRVDHVSRDYGTCGP